MRSRFIALAASVLALASCADHPQLPATPAEMRVSAASASNGVVQSINGNADIQAPEGLRRMEIHARKSADGTVSGRFFLKQRWGDEDTYEADVVCFTIVGNRAYVGGVLTKVNGVPYEEYASFRLVMVDNGEGASAAPDQSSQAFSFQQPGQPQLFCSNASLVLPMYDLVRGNLQIRP
ncbi:hypothetical protein [Longimicrobium sp.]|uniref:hypothetical protein n=1 Tax=Longimicrobium sp. TaxID=2029185 RepID=UPI003B3B7F5A